MSNKNIDIADQMENSVKAQRVILYSASACNQCNEIRNYFIENEIEFTEKDIVKDQLAAIEMMRGSRSKEVPQVNTDDIRVIGYKN
jgi:glutaredoxin